jgi:hypothetical protein
LQAFVEQKPCVCQFVVAGRGRQAGLVQDAGGIAQNLILGLHDRAALLVSPTKPLVVFDVSM